VRNLGRMRALVVALVVGALVGIGAIGLEARQGTPVAGGGVVREVLVAGEPAGAPGQVLELVRYTIPAGTLLPAHTHPGMQAAFLESGTLHYTVLDGEVPVMRAAVGGGTPVADAVAAGEGEAVIRAGDSFVEAAGIVHFGRNAGPEPVVILVSSLFAQDEPPASVVTIGTPVP